MTCTCIFFKIQQRKEKLKQHVCIVSFSKAEWRPQKTQTDCMHSQLLQSWDRKKKTNKKEALSASSKLGYTNTKKNKLNEDALPTSMKVGHEKRK
jgi:hypothetical protein